VTSRMRTLWRAISGCSAHALQDRGDTMIEVLIAAVIGVTIVGAVTGLFLTGNDQSLASQRQSELIAVADQQIENIRQEVKTNANGFAALAMSSLPATGSSATLSGAPNTYTDPNHFVSASSGCGLGNDGYTIETNYDNTSEGVATISAWSNCATGVEPLVVQNSTLTPTLPTGIVTPQQTSVPVGGGTATVDSYVTDTNIGGCASVGNSCSGAASTYTGDARRVIVAVFFNGTSRSKTGGDSPVYVSTIFTSPVPSNQTNSSIGITLGAQLG